MNPPSLMFNILIVVQAALFGAGITLAVQDLITLAKGNKVYMDTKINPWLHGIIWAAFFFFYHF